MMLDIDLTSIHLKFILVSKIISKYKSKYIITREIEMKILVMYVVNFPRNKNKNKERSRKAFKKPIIFISEISSTLMYIITHITTIKAIIFKILLKK